MKTFSFFKRAALLGLTAVFLTACGGNTAPGGGGGGNLPSGSLADLNGTYNGTYQINDETNDVFFNGLTTFTVTNGQISGTMTNDNDFDFEDDTGVISGTLRTTSESELAGRYDADLTMDFVAAPDYTASTTLTYGSGNLFGGGLTLRRDGDFVGDFSLITEKE